ncbi:hypothetical protein SDJN02_06806, partial [Cucurbita argyrosperma subsp. argyrosperma]
MKSYSSSQFLMAMGQNADGSWVGMLIETLNSTNSAISYSCPNHPACLPLQRDFKRAVAEVWQADILSAFKDASLWLLGKNRKNKRKDKRVTYCALLQRKMVKKRKKKESFNLGSADTDLLLWMVDVPVGVSVGCSSSRLLNLNDSVINEAVVESHTYLLPKQSPLDSSISLSRSSKPMLRIKANGCLMLLLDPSSALLIHYLLKGI